MATGRFADYFKHSDTADVKVVIQVVQTEENFARRQLQLQGTVCETANADLCAHSILLMCNSPVWKAQLERWQGTSESKRITMMIEEGEQAAAYKLLQCLYTDSLPDLETEVDLRINLGILMLADQYQVKAALLLCGQKLEKLTDLGLISWDLADRVIRRPAGYLEKPAFSCLLVKVQEKILQHVAGEPSLPGIGLDLEVVMRNSKLEASLMALPLRKCADLLSDGLCRVGSENTVAAAVVRRVDHERMRSYGYGDGNSDGDVECVESAELRAQIMADVIRVPHLSTLFAAAMPAFASRLGTVMRPEKYALGRELSRLPAGVQKHLLNLSQDPPMAWSWLSRSRPPSTVTALEFDWELSAAVLADKFDSGTRLLARSPKHFFAGMDWEVELTAKPVPDDVGCSVGLFVFGDYPLSIEGPPYGAMSVNFHILAPDNKSSLHSEGLMAAPAGEGWGWPDIFHIPPMQKWDQSRMQKWTSSTGLITVRVKVSDVM